MTSDGAEHEKQTQRPGFKEGLIALPLEVYHTIFGPTMCCPECGDRWRGYYALHMQYCHFCGKELDEL